MHAADVTVEQHALLTRSWQQATPLPVAGPGRLVLALTLLRGLREVRHQVQAFSRASAGAEALDAVERAVLVIDELTSNALLHG